VVELIVMAALGFAALVVLGTLMAGAWLLFLPFRLLGWIVKGVGMILFLPLILLFGLVGVLIFGVGALFFMAPFLPFALLAFVLWRLMRRPRSTAVPH
jgi:hypothetical protein